MRRRAGADERRLFALGAAGLLLAMLLLAKSHITAVDRQFGGAEEAAVRVNVNTADVGTLTLLQQIGPKRAEAIVAHRERFGPYRTYPDLMRVDGIGRETVEGLLGQVCFDEPLGE